MIYTDVAVRHFTVDILSTDPNDPIRNINLWMPDYNGESLVVQNWQPGDTTSPFHPLFLERLSGFDTLRFMDWQMTNYNIEVIGWEDRAMLDDISQGGVLEAPWGRVDVRHVVLCQKEHRHFSQTEYRHSCLFRLSMLS